WASSPTNVSSDNDTRRLIELRAANESLFTGRRNTAKPAWRGIVKEMGLTGKITPDQVAKKWDNLKTKFKDLKFPPRGMEGQTNPASWPWFQLMSDALEGRLTGKAPRVTPHPDPAPRHRPRAAPAPPPAPPTSRPSSSDYAADAFGDGAEQNQRSSETCDGPLGGLEREWEMVERERAALEREREMVERDRAALERERAAVQAERLWLDRERAAVERDRAMVEQERAALGRDREGSAGNSENWSRNRLFPGIPHCDHTQEPLIKTKHQIVTDTTQTALSSRISK
uniref:Myb/SANT-like DNA-binding domain-containing protein n=1 Tax=Neolamprologus brichardi TaxID=32507 RepID=A0A3Q4I263_NEOBR